MAFRVKARIPGVSYDFVVPDTDGEVVVTLKALTELQKRKLMSRLDSDHIALTSTKMVEEELPKIIDRVSGYERPDGTPVVTGKDFINYALGEHVDAVMLEVIKNDMSDEEKND